jgi:hypothetical protein
MALLFGHEDGKEQVAGDPGVGGAPARNRQRPDRVGRPDPETLGGIRYEAWREGFSRRKLSVLTPTAAMSAVVVTLMGRCCGYLLHLGLRVKTLDLLGLDDGGALRCNPFEGVVVELWSPSVSPSVSGGKLWFS